MAAVKEELTDEKVMRFLAALVVLHSYGDKSGPSQEQKATAAVNQADLLLMKLNEIPQRKY